MAGAPLTLPTPNLGAQSQGALMVSEALDKMRQASANLDPNSELGQAVLTALKTIGRHVGAPPPEAKVSSLFGQLIEARRNAMQRLALLQLQNRQGAPPGAQMPPGGAAAGAPTVPQGVAA